MANVIVATNEYPQDKFKVFLAGAIDMGSAVNWQQQVIETLKDRDMILLNPRRPKFTPEMEVSQIKWELKALEEAQLILMWIPRAAKAPISLLEFGLYIRSGKLIIGVENGFYRQCNVELTAQHYKLPVYHSLEEIIEQLPPY